jgi:hypothetical protein
MARPFRSLITGCKPSWTETHRFEQSQDALGAAGYLFALVITFALNAAHRDDFNPGDVSQWSSCAVISAWRALSMSASRSFPGDIVWACALARAATCDSRPLKETACVS